MNIYSLLPQRWEFGHNNFYWANPYPQTNADANYPPNTPTLGLTGVGQVQYLYGKGSFPNTVQWQGVSGLGLTLDGGGDIGVCWFDASAVPNFNPTNWEFRASISANNNLTVSTGVMADGFNWFGNCVSVPPATADLRSTTTGLTCQYWNYYYGPASNHAGEKVLIYEEAQKIHAYGNVDEGWPNNLNTIAMTGTNIIGTVGTSALTYFMRRKDDILTVGVVPAGSGSTCSWRMATQISSSAPVGGIFGVGAQNGLAGCCTTVTYMELRSYDRPNFSLSSETDFGTY